MMPADASDDEGNLRMEVHRWPPKRLHPKKIPRGTLGVPGGAPKRPSRAAGVPKCGL